jgi:hypothetical protein
MIKLQKRNHLNAMRMREGQKETKSTLYVTHNHLHYYIYVNSSLLRLFNILFFFFIKKK